MTIMQAILMNDSYEPRKGDRLLVDNGDIPGGRSGTVCYNIDGELCVHTDGGWPIPIERFTVLQLLHRPAPPRPEVESFTRSDGSKVKWRPNALLPNLGVSPTPEDADAFARMYSQAAEQMRWDAEYEQ